MTLRPIGSPLPLGAFTLVPAGILIAGLQLNWFSPAEAKAIPLLILGFAVPLQLTSSILAFLGRDALVGTGFGIFTGVWLALGILPIGRRARARAAIDEGLHAQLSELEHEAGVREQL